MLGDISNIARNLGGGGNPLVIDFTVFSMGVVTLAFILVVEVIRHKIDHLAKGKDFFSNVLDSVYRELSTLGLVEAGVFILHHYYTGMDIEVEKVFAEVHFTLFFVAIINAIQSVILFHFTSRVAFHNWVRMEDIDINHYIAIRRKFEMVEKQLNASTTDSQANSGMTRPVSAVHLPVDELYQSTNISQRWNYLQQIIHHPVLLMKYRQLLVQVRFHELRVHFIESNKLPPKFHVSSYLLLSLNDAFHNLVHISTFAWIFLIGIINLIYFIMGIVAYKTGSESAIGSALTYIFFGYCITFLIFSLIVAKKMKRIFFRIMKDEKWANLDSNADHDANNNNSGSQPGSLVAISMRSAYSKKAAGESVSQLDLFWGSNPKFIIIAGQMMQFGYAIAFAILLVFNKSLTNGNNKSAEWWLQFIFVPLVCYLCFVWLWSSIIPEYTQCTSLGELVQRKHLVDTEAKFRLQEAKKKRLEEIDQIEVDKAQAERSQIPEKKKQPNRRVRQKSQPILFGGLRRSSAPKESMNTNSEDGGSSSRADSERRLNQLSEFVKKPTEDLPELHPSTRRKRRVRAVSDGVGAMRLFPTTSAVAQEALSSDLDEPPILMPSVVFAGSEVDKEEIMSKRPPRQRRKKAFSTGVLQMQQLSDELDDIKETTTNKSSQSKLFAQSKSLQQSKLFAQSKSLQQSKSLAPLCEVFPPSSASLQVTNQTMVTTKVETTKYNKPQLSSPKVPLPQNTSKLQIRDDMKVSYDYTNDDNSIQTDTSSEVDDDMSVGVPDIVDMEESARPVPFRKQLRNFLSSSRFQNANAVFGTMIAFYLVSTRTMLMLQEWCIIPDNSNTWNFIPLEAAFWVEFIYLICFIVESITTCIIFWDVKLNMTLAGIFDLMISCTCFGLLIAAEEKRCCEDSCDWYVDHSSFLIGYAVETYADLASECTKPPVDFECCSRFGSRLCGQIGSIEPFTALIALRLLKYGIGDYLSRVFVPYCEENGIQEISHRKLHDVEHDKGTIVEFWKSAVEKHPDIVEKHGLYSGQLLEAMLGFQELPSPSMPSQPGTVPEKQDIVNKEGKFMGKVYSESKRLSTSAPARSISLRSLSGGGSIKDLDGFELAAIGTELARPNAVLIRRMRRGQCKMLPLLDEWATVDVVLTKYEIVWFDIVEASVDDHLLQSSGESKLNDSGGKGQRLCDVAQGRIPLGSLLLSEITNIKILRTPPSAVKEEQFSVVDSDEETNHFNDGMNKEYWSKSANDEDSKPGGKTHLPCQTRWDLVTEDKVKLVSAKGTLFLRFLVDLLEQEGLIEDTMKTHITESNQGCLLWCQSISHLVGKQQLKQNLPHFGETTKEELSDFIEIAGNKNMDFLHRPHMFSTRKVGFGTE